MYKNHWIQVGAAFMALALVSHSAYADSGKVIDGSTGKPLADVYIFAIWQAAVVNPVDSRHTCFKVDVTQTSSRGAFHMSSWSGNINPLLVDRQRSPLFFYKRGYKSPEGAPKNGDAYVMTPDRRTAVDRLEDIGGIGGRTSCGSEDQRRAVLPPLYRAVYQEAQEIAKSPEELQYLNSILWNLETLELGSNKALDNYSKRKVEWAKVPDHSDKTRFLAALISGDHVTLEAMLKSGFDPNTTYKGWVLLKGGFNAKDYINIPQVFNGTGYTPLIIATDRADFETMHLLSQYHANPNALDFNDEPILDHAMKSRQRDETVNTQLVVELLRAGADPNFSGALRSNPLLRGFTPFLNAVSDGRTSAVVAMIRAGANVNDKPQPVHPGYFHEMPVLCYARLPEIRKALLDAGASGDHGPYGDTPLMLAAEEGDLERVQQLLAWGADVNAKTNLGQTPLYFAVMRAVHNSGIPPNEAKYEPLVKAILDAGAKLDAKAMPIIPGQNGVTALDIAKNDGPIRSLLLETAKARSAR